MNIKKIATVIAVAAGISLGATGVAHAAASASSVSILEGLIFTDNSGGDGTGTQLDISDFNTGTLNFVSTAGINGNMTAAGGFLDSGFSVVANPIDLAGQCVGSGCPAVGPLGGENNFDPNEGYPTTGNYASADQSEIGSPITGLNPAVPSSATISSGAWVGVDTGNAFGSANADNNLNATFEFVLASALPNGAGITFDWSGYTEAFTDAGEVIPTTATAAIEQSFVLYQNNADGTQTLIFEWLPGNSITGGIEVLATATTNTDITRQSPANGRTFVGGGIGIYETGSFAAYTGALAANQSYTLEARTNNNADVVRAVAVPEPTILAIFGAGMLAMSISTLGRRRRKAS